MKFTKIKKIYYIGILLFIFLFIIYLFLQSNSGIEGLPKTEIITNTPIYPNTLMKQSFASILTPNGIPLNNENMGFSFTITLKKPANSYWQQIFGITVDGPNNATDKRVLAVWICPNSTNLHIRTSTNNDGNYGITGSLDGLLLNQPIRVDIIRKKQQNYYTFTVTLFNSAGTIIKEIQTPQIPNIRYCPKTGYNTGYIYSTYSNWNDLFSGEVKNMIYIVSNDPITHEQLTYKI